MLYSNIIYYLYSIYYILYIILDWYWTGNGMLLYTVYIQYIDVN